MKNDHMAFEVSNLEGEDDINPKLLRSVLYFDDERQVFIGQKAITQYIGDSTNGRYLQSIKTFLPDLNFNFTSICDQDYALEELISIILKKMKTRGEELLNQEVSDVVLGRPASFDDPLPGLPVLRILPSNSNPLPRP
jgi:hypothetical chaperone protein